LNLSWLCTRASQTFSGTFSGTLLNLTCFAPKSEGSGEVLGGFCARSQVRFNRVLEKVPEKVPEKIPEKVCKVLVQNQVKFDRVAKKPFPDRARVHNKFVVESICMTRPICSVSFKCKTKKGRTSFFHGDNSWN
jgi:hypothetical protein